MKTQAIIVTEETDFELLAAVLEWHTNDASTSGAIEDFQMLVRDMQPNTEVRS